MSRIAAVLLGSVLLGSPLLLAGCGEATEAGPGSGAGAAETATVTPSPSTGASETGSPSADATPVPAVLKFSGTTVDGGAFDGAALAGRPVVLWFWAPWCPTCRGQIPTVTELARRYGDDVGFVGVGSLDSGEAIAGFADAAAASKLTHLTDPDGAVWRHFGITAQSTFVVLDVQGTELARGYISADDLGDLVADLA